MMYRGFYNGLIQCRQAVWKIANHTRICYHDLAQFYEKVFIMNKKLKTFLIVFSIVLLLAIVLYFTFPLIISSIENAYNAKIAEENPQGEAAPAVSQTPEEEPENVEHINTISAGIAFAGDVILNQLINEEAKVEDGYDFAPIFGDVRALIESADFSACSLMTTFNSGGVYSSFPKSVSPPHIASSLAACGFDLLNLASRHSMDSFYDGLVYTINKVEESVLAHIGTYRSADEKNANGGAVIRDINGINIAFTSYTTGSSYVPISGFEYALNVCVSDYLSEGERINYELIQSDMSRIKESGAEFIVVMVSWDDEFSKEVSRLQRELVDYLIMQGADVVVGSGTKVPQLIEKRSVTLEDGSKRQGMVAYSLGNLLYFEEGELTDISAILNLNVTKDTDTGEIWLSELSYTPIKMLSLSKYGIEGQGWNHRLFNIDAFLGSYENKTQPEFASEEIAGDFRNALSQVVEIMGNNYYINK